MNETVEQLRESVGAQLRARPETPGDEVQFWLDLVDDLSIEAKVLAHAIAGAHLTREQLRKLKRDPKIGQAVTEMRRVGLLVPLEGVTRTREKTVVYYFPPSKTRYVRAALTLLEDLPQVIEDLVKSKLDAVGYPDVPTFDELDDE